MKASRAEFDGYVTEAMAGIEPEFGRHFREVPVVVEDEPDEEIRAKLGLADGRGLLGVFRGQPLNRRGGATGGGPSQIVLYRRNIVARCRRGSELAEQIRKTLIHELGHYLGFSEGGLRRGGG